MRTFKIIVALITFMAINRTIWAGNPQLDSVSKIISTRRSTESRYQLQKYAIFNNNNDFAVVSSYTESGDWGRLFDWNISVIDSKGSVKINNKYLGRFHTLFTDEKYPSQTVIQLNGGNIIAFGQWHFNTGGEMFISVVNSKGEIVKNDSILTNLGPKPQLIKNLNNDVFVIGGYNGYWEVRKVYPYIEKKVQYFHAPNGLGDDFIALPINNEQILMFVRPWPHSTEYQSNELGCFKINYMGNVYSTISKIDIDQYAFRVIDNAYLPGGARRISDEKNIVGLDIAKTANGEYILSVNNWDQNDSICIYQIKLNKAGEPIKPDKLEYVKPISLEETAFPKNTKIGIASWAYKNNDSDKVDSKQYWVFWGFDKKTNFYWTRLPVDK